MESEMEVTIGTHTFKFPIDYSSYSREDLIELLREERKESDELYDQVQVLLSKNLALWVYLLTSVVICLIVILA